MRLLQAVFPLLLAVPLSGVPLNAGAWEPSGLPLCGLDCQPGIPRPLPDGEGGAYVAWTGRAGQSLNADILVQRITSAGTIAPGWPAEGVAACLEGGDQYLNAISSDGRGGILLAWQDWRGPSADIYVQRILPTGEVAPGWPPNGVQASADLANQNFAVICEDGNGGVLVVWEDRRNIGTLREDVFAQHVTGDGSVDASWPPDGLPVAEIPARQGSPRIVSDGLGGAIIAWNDGRDDPPDGAGLYGIRLDGGGSAYSEWGTDGSSFGVTGGLVDLLRSDGSDFYLTRRTFTPDFFDGQYYVHRFTLDGEVAPGWPGEGVLVCNAPGDRADLNAAEDGMGGVVLAWYDYRLPGSDIYASSVLPNGTLAPGIPPDGLLVSDPFQPNEGQVGIAPDGAGGMYVVWEWHDGFTSRCRLQHVTAGGGVAPGWPPYGQPVSTSESQRDPALASDGMGGVYAVWSEGGSGRRGLFAALFSADGPVPTLPSLVSAEANESGIRLLWHAKDARLLEASVYRRTEGSAWAYQGTPEIASPDELRYDDEAVTPGERYAYRLGYFDGATESFTEEAWVEAAAPLAFALEGFRPNPAVGLPIVSLTFAKSEPARLEVFDLRGRLVLRRDLSGLGAGRHTISLENGVRLAAGVYVLRLTQGNQVAHVRGVMLD